MKRNFGEMIIYASEYICIKISVLVKISKTIIVNKKHFHIKQIMYNSLENNCCYVNPS